MWKWLSDMHIHAQFRDEYGYSSDEHGSTSRNDYTAFKRGYKAALSAKPVEVWELANTIKEYTQIITPQGIAQAILSRYNVTKKTREAFEEWWASNKEGWLAAKCAADAKYLPVIEKLVAIVNQQAEDEGLWFVAQYASEGYLQKELRLLHAAIEELAAPLLEKKRGV
ncbi:MAG: hypothetical protein ACK5PR_01940 [bacterium]|jgi:hypothetical protein